MSLLILAAAAGLCIANIHDGDTLTLCTREKVRIANIDAPELTDSPRCSPQQRQRLAGSKNPAWCDYRAGAQSRDALRAFVLTGRVTIERVGQDRYGRTLAQIYVGDRDAGEYLIARGLARPWRK
ncbi:hypothetical protein NRB_22180 [Novosphingobium sp. 11B]